MKLATPFLACLLLSSCSGTDDTHAGEAGSERTAQGNGANPFAMATASRSLIFPLSFDASANPPKFTKVEGREPGETDPKDLMFAVAMCGSGLSWFDSNSHWAAMVIPSSSSAIWNGDKEDHPSDSEIVDCVRSWYPRTFFYALSQVGYDTSDPTLPVQ
jgi:hypothetical protein